MSRRHILNITSKKKQDTMVAVNNISPITVGGYQGGTAQLLFCPTYRFRDPENNAANADPQAGRTSLHTYAKGIREKIFMTTAGGSPVRWRRIIFSTKNDLFALVNKYQFSSGTQVRSRPLLPLTLTEIGILLSETMEGAANTDFIGALDGKLDPDRVTIHTDRNMVINPGNSNGSTRIHNFYTPLERNLTYRDNEFGNETTSSAFADQRGKGLGNVFIWDIFETVVTTDPVSQIQFLPNTTYYWHEK